MAGETAIESANNGLPIGWIVPTYRNARPVWRFVESLLRPVIKSVIMNRSEMTVRFPSGGWFGVYTADNAVSILGEAFGGVICEEAARFAPDVWQETILPTLADLDGWAMLISTPRGRNWFYNEFQRGLSDGKLQASFTAPSNANPMPNIRKAFELARDRVSERTFKQEWMAEFIDDGGGVFRNVRALSTLSIESARPDGKYLVGVDWGRSNDATVFSVWDVGAMKEVKLDRMTDTDFTVQITRLKALSERYNNAAVRAESNGMGDPLITMAQRAGLYVYPFYTSNLTKAHIIDGVALLCEKHSVKFQADPVGIGEMEAFESTRTSTGLVKYAAPDGMHDDIVMARAIALDGINKPTGAGLVSFG